MVGDTTSMLLGSYAGMNFLDFFWMQGRPGIFWGVELGALASMVALLVLFRKDTQKVSAAVETNVTDYVPSALMIATVGLLIVASFLPEPSDPTLLAIYNLRSGLVCVGLCLIGIVRDCIRKHSGGTFLRVLKDLDKDTLLLLFGLFMVIEGIRVAGVIDAAADLFYNISGDNPFMLYTLVVFASVVLSAFIDNIPYVATMLPVVEGIAALMNGGAGLPPYVFYFGLLTGATLGRQPHAHRRLGQYRRHRHTAQERRNGRPAGFPAHRRALYAGRRAHGIYLHLDRLGNLNLLKKDRRPNAAGDLQNADQARKRKIALRQEKSGAIFAFRRGKPPRPAGSPSPAAGLQPCGKTRILRSHTPMKAPLTCRLPCFNALLFRHFANIKARVHARALQICYSTFHQGSLASSGKDHFHTWKEQSRLGVRMDKSPSENLNFSAQLCIHKRTRTSDVFCSNFWVVQRYRLLKPIFCFRTFLLISGYSFVFLRASVSVL